MINKEIPTKEKLKKIIKEKYRNKSNINKR